MITEPRKIIEGDDVRSCLCCEAPIASKLEFATYLNKFLEVEHFATHTPWTYHEFHFSSDFNRDVSRTL